MRLAPFPKTSPWFRASLMRDMTTDDIEQMEPRDGVLMGIAEKNRAYYRATIVAGEDRQTVSFATGFTAAQAVMSAHARLLEGDAA